MSAPSVVTRDPQLPLEAALLDVHATLADLLAAADEQYAAVAARDAKRLESVTWQQERLSVRLERAERRRIELLGGAPLQVAVASLPAPDAVRVSPPSTSITQ